MEEILKQILTELKDLKQGQENTNQRLDKMEDRLSNLETGQISLTNKVDNIFISLQETDVKQATSHLELISVLNKIKSDIDFIGHKEFENEKEVFNIKKHLEIVK